MLKSYIQIKSRKSVICAEGRHQAINHHVLTTQTHPLYPQFIKYLCHSLTKQQFNSLFSHHVAQVYGTISRNDHAKNFRRPRVIGFVLLVCAVNCDACLRRKYFISVLPEHFLFSQRRVLQVLNSTADITYEYIKICKMIKVHKSSNAKLYTLPLF